jgi:hypothetical protein
MYDLLESSMVKPSLPRLWLVLRQPGAVCMAFLCDQEQRTRFVQACEIQVAPVDGDSSATYAQHLPGWRVWTTSQYHL